ncbi:MAG: cardiolipin synthase ClsC [Bdellovibrio sp.]
MKSFILSFFICFNAWAFAPYPYYFTTATLDKGNGEHQTMLLHSGIAALQKRIDMIRKAQKSILIETFIWEKDRAGRILFEELIQKKKRDPQVKIQLLIDESITVWEMDDFVGEYLKGLGIEVSFYNRALDPVTAQFRTHRKIFVIDDKEAIIGGRNIGDDYFDLDHEYNFLDRDIWVDGVTAKAVADSFYSYWNDSSITRRSTRPNANNARRLMNNPRNQRRYEHFRNEMIEKNEKEVREWFDKKDFIPELMTKIEEVARPILNESKIHKCSTLTFVSDRPGAKWFKQYNQHFYKTYRILDQAILDRLSKGSDVWLESTYFILNKRWEKTVTDLLKNKVNVKVVTNSLNSTDAFYVSALFYHDVFKYIEQGLEVHQAHSRFDDYTPVIEPEIAKARWGIHAKSIIFSEDSGMVASYNIDNRSSYFNNELAIFCDGSKSFVEDLKSDMLARMERSYHLINDKVSIDKSGQEHDIYAGASEKSIRTMKAIKLPSLLFEPLM